MFFVMKTILLMIKFIGKYKLRENYVIHAKGHNKIFKSSVFKNMCHLSPFVSSFSRNMKGSLADWIKHGSRR